MEMEMEEGTGPSRHGIECLELNDCGATLGARYSKLCEKCLFHGKVPYGFIPSQVLYPMTSTTYKVTCQR